MGEGNTGQRALIELQYLPPVAFFACLVRNKHTTIEAHEHFIKQTYRNRCYIVGANKIEMLSIPVQKGNRKTLVKDIKIDYNHKWLNNHQRAIISAYGKAPFFEYYFSYFDSIFLKGHEFLFDLNWELLTLCLDLLQIGNTLALSDKYEKAPEAGVIDLRSSIHPKKGLGNDSFFVPHPYNQVFGKNFVGNMSIVDLLFCEGPNARTIISKSVNGN